MTCRSVADEAETFLAEHNAAMDALHGHTDHTEDPDGPCRKGRSHRGPCE